VCLYIRRGCSAIFCGLSCSRLFNYGVFFCVCMASLLGQVAPVVVALLDTPVLVALYLLCGMPSNEVHAFPPHPFPSPPWLLSCVGGSAKRCCGELLAPSRGPAVHVAHRQ
jgi:hypothetical protein